MSYFGAKIIKLKRTVADARMRISSLFVSALLAAMPIVPFMVGRANAVADVTGPTPTSLSVSSNSANVTSTPVQITLSGTVSDDLSGLGNVRFHYTSPSGVQVNEGEVVSLSTTDFTASVTFPRYAEAGVWVPTMSFADNSGNLSDYTGAELSGLGFSLNMTVSATVSDTTAPTASALSQEKEEVDTSIGGDQNILAMTASDNLSGIALATVTFTSPSANVSVRANFSPTGVTNEYSANPNFGAHIEVGRWTAQLTISDAAGNTKVYDTSDLTSLGYPDGVDVVGDPDTTPVAIESLGFAPIGEFGQEVPVSGAIFMLSGIMTDNLSGVQQAEVIYRSQTTGQVSNSYSVYTGSGDEIRRDFYVVTPPYAAEGLWLPELVTNDEAGNSHTYSNSELVSLGYDLSVTLGQIASATVGNGGTVTTDPGTGATVSDPIQASVTTPTGGTVSVVRIDTPENVIENGGFNFFGTEYNINAPAATVAAPLVLTFVIDASQLADLDLADINVYRDGIVIDDCVSPNTADPDPCVKSRATVTGGDAQIVVNTSHASNWTVGYETAASGGFHFQKFKKPVKAAPHLNKTEGGDAIPVKFSVGGNFGTNILTTGSPTSQRINCDTKQLMGDSTSTDTTNDKGLKYKNDGFYRYNWKTLKKWKGTCRQFTLSFTNGETAYAYFKFKD